MPCFLLFLSFLQKEEQKKKNLNEVRRKEGCLSSKNFYRNVKLKNDKENEKFENMRLHEWFPPFFLVNSPFLLRFHYLKNLSFARRVSPGEVRIIYSFIDMRLVMISFKNICSLNFLLSKRYRRVRS